MRLSASLALACLALAAGCATTDAPFGAHLASESQRVRQCAEWYRQLDERIDAAGVRDAQDAPVAGFPYLRVNRLLAALRPAATTNERALQALGERMLLLDLEARRLELRNLPLAPAEDAPGTRGAFGLGVALERTAECGRLLNEIDLDRKSTRLNSSHIQKSRMPSSA